VCAHPDDESFGLGAVLSTFSSLGMQTNLLCFTHGEASTLGADGADLAVVREHELTAAGALLGIRSLRLLAHPDGGLTDVAVEALCEEVVRSSTAEGVDCLVVFDEGGITGHPDHQRATAAAMAAGESLGIPVLAWTLAEAVATALNNEFGAPFIGRSASEIDFVIEVDREQQHRAIACHASQATDNPVLRRRLELQGSSESLRWLRAPDTAS
jgi:LmbE family N-acetylglucosaminyl deacetylase